jgi:hypothetical protein
LFPIFHAAGDWVAGKVAKEGRKKHPLFSSEMQEEKHILEGEKAH